MSSPSASISLRFEWPVPGWRIGHPFADILDSQTIDESRGSKVCVSIDDVISTIVKASVEDAMKAAVEDAMHAYMEDAMKRKTEERENALGTRFTSFMFTWVTRAHAGTQALWGM